MGLSQVLLELLADVAAKQGLLLTEQHLDSLRLLLKELLRWNSRMNLTAITNQKQMVIKHIADSMELLPFMPAGVKLLDIGSGAGFPALVLSIFRADSQIHSLDSVAKKINFQRHIKRLLKLQNITLLHQRVENLIENEEEPFELVTSRAFSSMELFLKLAAPLVAEQGKIVAMRSRVDRSETGLLQVLASSNGFIYEQQHDYDLPNDEGRRSLLIFVKQLK